MDAHDADDLIQQSSSSSFLPTSAVGPRRFQPSVAAAPSSLASLSAMPVAVPANHISTFSSDPAATSTVATSTTSLNNRRELQQTRRFVEGVEAQLKTLERSVARARDQLEREKRSFSTLQDQEQQLLRELNLQHQNYQRSEAVDAQKRQARAEVEHAEQQAKFKQTLHGGGVGGKSGQQPSKPDLSLFQSSSAPNARALQQLEQQLSFVRSLLSTQEATVYESDQALRLAERERDLVLLHQQRLEPTAAAVQASSTFSFHVISCLF
jgi:hypothetical protein